jgi:hypothetical protein
VRLRLARWWRLWGFLTAFASLTNAAALYWQWDTQRSTAKAAKAACERSREFGPALVDGLERQRTVPPDVIRFYRRTIPKVCPK